MEKKYFIRKITNKLALKHNPFSLISHSIPNRTRSSTGDHLSPSYLSDDGIHLLHAQGDDAREKGLEHLARFLDHHLKDLQELLDHPTASAAFMEYALGQLFSADKRNCTIAKEMCL